MTWAKSLAKLGNMLPIPEPIPDPVRARYFAELAHQGQTYEDGLPYTFHLGSVVDVGARFGITDPRYVCAFWLHDCLEDTNRSYNDVKKPFGFFVAETVFAVTSELGRNRKERNLRTYPKIFASGPGTVTKCVDRIANGEYGVASDVGGKYEMYRKEYPEFRAGIYNPDHFEAHPVLPRLWAYLDSLFRYTP